MKKTKKFFLFDNQGYEERIFQNVILYFHISKVENILVKCFALYYALVKFNMKVINAENMRFKNKRFEHYYLVLIEEMTCMKDLMNTKQLHAEWIDEKTGVFSMSNIDFDRITCTVIANTINGEVAIQVHERG